MATVTGHSVNPAVPVAGGAATGRRRGFACFAIPAPTNVRSWARMCCRVDRTIGERVDSVSGECLPTCEVPRTAAITASDGARIEVSMATLAGLRDEDPFRPLNALITEYDAWIQERTREARIPSRYQPAARRHLKHAIVVLGACAAGLEYLRTNPLAFRAFQLANDECSCSNYEGAVNPAASNMMSTCPSLTFLEPYPTIDLRTNDRYWRAFQAAFLLMSIESAGEPAAAERRTVDLIWSPTVVARLKRTSGLRRFLCFFAAYGIWTTLGFTFSRVHATTPNCPAVPVRIGS